MWRASVLEEDVCDTISVKVAIPEVYAQQKSATYHSAAIFAAIPFSE